MFKFFTFKAPYASCACAELICALHSDLLLSLVVSARLFPDIVSDLPSSKLQNIGIQRSCTLTTLDPFNLKKNVFSLSSDYKEVSKPAVFKPSTFCAITRHTHRYRIQLHAVKSNSIHFRKT